MANTYLFGASGHGRVIKEILNANGVKVEAFIDDNLAVNECAGRKVLHEYDGLSPVIVSIGVNRILLNLSYSYITGVIVYGLAVKLPALRENNL